MKLDISDSDITEVQLNDLLAGYEFDTIVISKDQSIFSNKRLKEMGDELELGFYQSDFGKVKVETV